MGLIEDDSTRGEKGDRGDKGDKGDKGDPGAKGEKGETGPAGANGNSTGLYDNNGNFVADIIDPSISLVMRTDGGIYRINFRTGGFDQSVFIGSGGLDTWNPSIGACGFTTADCTGTCYFVSDDMNEFSPIKNGVYRAGTNSFVIYKGQETLQHNIPMGSIFDSSGGTCFDLTAFNETIADSYALTTVYTLPTAPTALPLWIKRK